MSTPKAGSPTITLFQLHSNCHTRLDPQVSSSLNTVLFEITLQPQTAGSQGSDDPHSISEKYNSSSVMGGVCKVWYIIHRNILIYDY